MEVMSRLRRLSKTKYMQRNCLSSFKYPGGVFEKEKEKTLDT